MVATDVGNEIEKEALLEWEKELKDKVSSLEKEIKELETKEIQLASKVNLAYKAYARTDDEDVKEFIYGPLKEELEQFRVSSHTKVRESRREIGALDTVLSALEAKLKVMG